MQQNVTLQINTDIPSRPEALIKVTEALRAEHPNLEYICQSIKDDVALFTAVIATVNSAYFGLKQPINSIERAVSLLGLKRTFNIIQIAALRNSLSNIGTMERFWDTATEVARISAAISEEFSQLDSDQAYLLGMLHDCGIPLMMIAHPDFRDFLTTLNGCSLIEIHQQEIEKYGYSHYQLGAQLAEKWCLDKAIVTAIARQPVYLDTFSEPADEHETMRLNLCLLLVAKDVSDAYRHYWRIAQQQDPLIELKPVLAFLGISDFDYMDLKEDLVSRLNE